MIPSLDKVFGSLRMITVVAVAGSATKLFWQGDGEAVREVALLSDEPRELGELDTGERPREPGVVDPDFKPSTFLAPNSEKPLREPREPDKFENLAPHPEDSENPPRENPPPPRNWAPNRNAWFS